MNKRVNRLLNYYEFIFISIIVLFISLIAYINIDVEGLKILEKILFFGIIPLEICVVSIELLLFLFFNKRIKVFYVIYLFVELLAIILINKTFVFSGLIVLIVFSVIKMIFRIKYVDMIYNTKLFRRYCRLFNIKFKRVTSKKKKVTKTNRARSTASGKPVKSYA